MGGFILFLLFVGLAVAAMLAIRKAVNDERERKQREEEDRLRREREEQDRRRREEEAERQRKARDDADRREREAKQRYEEMRVKQLSERARKCVAEALIALERLLESVRDAESGYKEALVEYERVKPYPFWRAAYKSYNGIDVANTQLRVLMNKQVAYYQFAVEIPGHLPPFIDLSGIELLHEIVRAIHPKLDELVYNAYGQKNFDDAYGFLLVEKAIKEVMSALSERLEGIENAIRQSTMAITSGLVQTNRRLEAIQAQIAYDNAEQADRYRSMMGEINRGVLVATASANSNALTAQKQARTTISELRNIKRRL